MTRTLRQSCLRRLPHALAGLSGLLLIGSGCEKLVGVGDTQITRDGNAGANTAGRDAAAGAGNSGMSFAGSPAAGATGNDAGSPAEAGGTSGSSGTAGSPSTGGTSGNAGSPATAGSSGTSGGAGTGGMAPCTAPTPTNESGTCVVRGPTMVEVTDATPHYFIDSSEVTSKQYDTFLAANPPITGQRPGCAWNASFAPSDVTKGDEQPVAYVDFCDAAAYCAWADKRLCGAIASGSLVGTDPTVDTMPDVLNVKKSEWYLACAGPKENAFCYGDVENDATCNEHSGNSYPSDVKSLPNCQGHYKGLFDMTGNAVEWIDACDGDKDNKDHCAIIGGSWASPPEAGCADYELDQRDDQAPALGFRCCSK